MITISGEMEAGEASRANAAVQRRLRGSKLSYYALMFGLYAAGAALGFFVGVLLRSSRLWPGVDLNWSTSLGFLAGGWSYLAICRPWTVQRFRQRMENRGFQLTFSQRLEISETGLVRQTGQVRSVAPWSAVTELLRVKGYLIFLVQMEPWYVPSRFFAGAAEEKAVLKEALDFMSPEARARSEEAESFAMS